MAADFFLKIDGVEGESTTRGHEGDIEIESFSWGVTNNASAAHGSGGGVSKAAAQDFHFVMRFNKASPQIFVAAASGKSFAKAVLSVRRGGKEQTDFLKWTLGDCLVTSYQTGGNETPVPESVQGAEEPSPEVMASRNASAGYPSDEFSLGFAKIEVSYQVQDNKGGLGTPVTGSWDFRGNKNT